MGCLFSCLQRTYTFKIECPEYKQGRGVSLRCDFYTLREELKCTQCGDIFIINNGETLDQAWLDHQRKKDRDLDRKRLLAAEDKIKVLTEIAEGKT